MQSPLFYLGNFAVIAYLAYIIGRQIYEARKLKNWQRTIDAEFASAETQMRQVRKQHLALIAKVYGEDVAEAVDKRLVYEQMSLSLLLASFGQPDKIQEATYKGVLTSKWYYGQSINRLGNYTYHFEVTMENYKVVGWKELK